METSSRSARETSRAREACGPPWERSGFTLIELLVVMALLGVLASMAVPRFKDVLESARTAAASSDIRALGREVAAFHATFNRYPANLAEINRSGLLDPWGHPYGYLRLSDGGSPKTDQFGVALNDDFDLWSPGLDGGTNASLSSPQSRDDVIRGGSGAFVGLASDF